MGKNVELLVVCKSGFSDYSDIKTKARSGLRNDNMENIQRVRQNGPRTLIGFEASRYARLWIMSKTFDPLIKPPFGQFDERQILPKLGNDNVVVIHATAEESEEFISVVERENDQDEITQFEEIHDDGSFHRTVFF
jgi:hypothetical protein